MSFRSGLSMHALALALACGALLTGCSGGKDAPPASTSGSAPASAAADSGAQTVSGRAPAVGGNYASIVVLEPVGGADPTPQAAVPRMDQVQETFIPSILLVRTGQPVDFLNNDDVLHNVRAKDADTKDSAFNVAIPTGQKYTHVFNHDGFYDVGCDIHPGMSAEIMASSSPYAAVADPSGTFAIAGVPNGPYKAIAYAGAVEIEIDVSVAAGMAPLDLTHQ
jgi:plastocyanin